MLTESGGAQRVMQNENLKYFIIPLVTHKASESWAAECVWRDSITCGSFTSIIPVRQVVAQHVVIYWVVVGWRFFPVKQSMNRIDMLFSINGLLILKDLIPFIHLRVTTIKYKLITAMIPLINNFRWKVR